MPAIRAWRALEAFTPEMKVARAAYARDRPGPHVRPLNVVFHDDVTFAAARQAIEDAGGSIEGSPTRRLQRHAQRTRARALGRGAETCADERVRAVYRTAAATGRGQRQVGHGLQRDAALLRALQPQRRGRDDLPL